MTQLEFEWGTPIVVFGRRKPDWLMNEVYQFRLMGCAATDWRLREADTLEPCWDQTEAIRLPVGHSAYSRVRKAADKAPPKMIDHGPDALPLGPNDPPGWAVVRAWNEVGGLVTPRSAILALARYIERHEKPPVDPDVLAVRAILAAWIKTDMPETDAAERYWNGESAKEIEAGRADSEPPFIAALEAYRTIKANGGVPSE